ncbi:MAG: hypothetical protein V7785_22005 [Bermanella sp.]
MIDGFIYSLINANALVQANMGDDVYPGVVPENIKGAAIRYVVSDSPSKFDSGGPESKQKSSIQIDVFHKDYSLNRQIGSSLHKQLHGYKGAQNATEISLLEVLDTDLTFDSKTREFRTTITLNVTYRET